MEEAEEKEAWSNFKDMKAGFRKRKEKDDTPEIPRAKKPRIEQAPTMEISRSWGLAENDGEYLPEGWRNEKVS